MVKNRKTLILIVDDNPQNLIVAADVMETLKFEYIIAMSGYEAFQSLNFEKPDLILLDIMMPDMDGYEVCKKIKEDPELADIPVIFISAKNQTEDIVKGFELGAVDYISKPFIPKELIARMRTQIELKNSKDDLKKTLQIMEKLSVTDELTGQYNRRYMIRRIDEEIAKNKRYDMPFAIAILDIDFFKKVNDRYGHNGGDYVLKELVSLMKATLREQDLVSRWGGEEFLVLLPSTDEKGALQLAERLRLAIEQFKFQYLNQTFHITITLGVTQYKPGDDMSETVKSADDGLYFGKKNGRNQVNCQRQMEAQQ